MHIDLISQCMCPYVPMFTGHGLQCPVKNKNHSGHGWIRRQPSPKASWTDSLLFLKLELGHCFWTLCWPWANSQFKYTFDIPHQSCYEVLWYLSMDPTRRTSAARERKLVTNRKIRTAALQGRSSDNDTWCCPLLTTQKMASQTVVCKLRVISIIPSSLQIVWLTHTRLYNDPAQIKSF